MDIKKYKIIKKEFDGIKEREKNNMLKCYVINIIYIIKRIVPLFTTWLLPGFQLLGQLLPDDIDVHFSLFLHPL